MRHYCLPGVCMLVGAVVAGPAWAQSALDPPPSLGQRPVMPSTPGTVQTPIPPQGLYPAQPQPWPQMTAPPAAPQTPVNQQPATMSQPPLTFPPQSAPIPAPTAAKPNGPTVSAVSVEKRGPDVVNLSQPLAYEIVVRNTGSDAVSLVRVEDELPAGARLVASEPAAELIGERMTWNLNTLDAGTERRLLVKLQLAKDGDFRSTATVHYAATASLQTRVVQPKLVLSLRGPEQAMSGDSVPFHVMVSNPGSGPVTNLALHCKLPDGLTHPQGQVVEAEVGTLPPGGSRSITLTTQAVKTGQLVNAMTATADGGLESSAQATVIVQGPMLQLSRSGPAKCYLKSEIGFELEVVNSGPVPAGYVEVGDTLPAGLDFVSATEGGRFDAANRTILWRLPALAAGARQKVAYRVKAVGLGEMPDRAAARTDRGGDVRADGTFTVEGIAALSLELVDLEDPIEVGADLTYEIRIVNQGSIACTNIQIVAQAPEGLMPHEGSGPTAYRANGLEVAFEPLQKLAIKADAVYRVKVRGQQPGDYRFRVQMTCDQLRQPVLKEEASRVYKEGP